MKAYRMRLFALVLLWLLNPFSALAATCDVDADGDVDIDDIAAILTARNQPASGPDDPRDADGDGFITGLDARACVVQCTLPRCERPSANQAPVADAGPDQTAFVGDTVTLNGGGSSDADGDSLTFSWSLSAPAGSLAVLSDPTAVAPFFTVDLPGDYVATLVVDDGAASSVPDSVTVSTLNSPPVANAGPDQSAFVLDTVTLNGAASSDVDGDSLTFSWSLTPPPGSAAVLSDPGAVAPTFVVDVSGDYIAQLVVNDGHVDSAPDTMTVSTLNSPPVANAGPDQSAFVLDTVTLNGAASFDVDGDPLTFSWSLTTPPGSVAALSDPGAVAPTFDVDVFGDFVAQLVVNDGLVDSAPDTMTVSTLNSPPVADAGPNQTALVGDTVTLDGSGSFDVDGNALTFSWSLTRPAGSSAALSDPTAVAPTFVVDTPGDYVAQLIVNDGFVGSLPDTMTVSTLNSPPVADAGPDQTVFVLDTVNLNGNGSFDVDGDALTFSWSLSTPAGSAAALSSTVVAEPSFVVDVPGDYVAQLIVNDGLVNSTPDTMTVSTLNSPPVADAGPDQAVFVGDTVNLDGSGSSDVDGDPLTFFWSLSSPAGSSAAPSDPAAEMPTFIADVPGDYVAQLIVNDGLVDSAADTSHIVASALPTLAVSSPATPEGDAGAANDIVFQVLLSPASAVPVTVEVQTAAQTATAGVDYESVPLTMLTFVPGETIKFVPVSVFGDDIVELDEDFFLQLSNPVNAAIVTGSGTGTILNDDAATLTIDDVALAEGDAGAFDFIFTVTLDNAVAGGLTVDYASADGSATVADGDYDTVVPGTLNFTGNAGEMQTVTVSVNGDQVVEPDEDFSVILSNLQAGGLQVVLGDDTGLGTILNDDTAALTIDDVTLAEGNSGTTDFVFNVILDNAVAGGLTVDYATVDGSAVAADGDYSAAVPGTLNFSGNAGETQTVTVSVNGDQAVEPDEDFSVILSNLQAGGLQVVLSDDTGLGTILNDDTAALAIDDVALAEGNSGTTDFVFTVTLDGEVPGGVTVDYASADDSATVADGDYTAVVPGTLNFSGNAGETQTVTVSVNGDEVVELDETFSVVLSNLQAGGLDVVFSDDTGLGTILNDDTAALSIDDVALAEGNSGTTDFVFNVTLNNAVAGGLTVDYASADDSATEADGDYTAVVPGTLNFNGDAGETQTVTVAVNGDQTVELDEAFSVVLSNLQAQGGELEIVLSDDTGVGTIQNDDTAALAIDDVALAEGDTGTTDFVFNVILSNAVAGGLTVDYASADGSAVAADGDYTAPAPGTLNFTGNAGETQTVTVAVNGDPTLELDEDFSVLLSNLQAGGLQVALGDDTGVGTIQNDDSVTIDIADVSQAEGDSGSSQFEFNVTLTGTADIAVSFTADSADGTATAGSDYFVVNGLELEIPPGGTGSTVSVEVSGDTDVEADETFVINLSTTQPGVVLGDAQGQGTIGNDDAALSINDVSLAEGDSGTTDFVFNVTIAQPSVLEVSATAQSADGTATAASGDYVALAPTPVTIPAGSTSTTVTVQVNGDTESEPDENFLVNLSAPSNATFADSQGQGTITNDDVALPGIGLAIVAGGPPVGVTRSATVQVTLASPAPAGGVTVTVTSDAPSILGVASPGTVSIPAGGSTGNITVNGIGEGSTALRANASGYLEGSLLVPVTLNLISIPETLSVPLGQTTSLPVSITPNPAPAGGLVIQLSGSNPGAVDIQTPTVTIPAGQFSANATVFGVAPGNSTVTASNLSYAPDAGVVTTSADLNILQSSLTINDTLPGDINIQLEVGGSPISAPAPGITVTVASDDPACVAATSPVVIATGLVNTISTISYGGSAALPCTANVTVSAPSITSDTIPVTVNPAPGITVIGLPTNVGEGLQDFCCTARLGAAQHGGVTMRIESLDPGVALVSPNGTTPGAAFFDTFVANGSRNVSFYVQALEDQAGNTATIQASAPGFNNGSDTVSVVQPALDIVGLESSLDTLDPDDPFFARVGIGTVTALTRVQAVRAGAPAPLAVDVNSSVAAVGDLVTTALTADSVTVEIAPGQSSTPGSVASGGVAFRSISAGITTVSVSASGLVTTNNGSRSVTVTNPVISLIGLPAAVGAGLQEFCCTGRLGATQHGGVTMHIESLDPSVALVSPNATTPGSTFIDVFVPNGLRDVSFFVHGLEGQAGSNATIEVSAPGFGTESGTISVVQPALDIIGLSSSLDTLDPDDLFNLRVGIGTVTGLTRVQAVRAGAPVPLVVDVNSSDAAVGDLVTNALTADSVTVEIAPGQSTLPGSVASGGIAFRPVIAGTTTVSVSAAGLLTTNNGIQSVTVTNPVISTFGFPATVGAGLQDSCCTGRLGATQHGGVTMHIESLDPSVALVSPNATTPGSAFIDVFVPNGFRDVSFYVHGLEGQAGSNATIEVSAPGFGSESGTVSVVQPALDILGLATSIDTLDPDDPFTVRIGIGSALGLSELQAVRAGAPATLIATVDSSFPGFGRLVTSALTGASVTVEIASGETSSPPSVATGGVAFEPLTTGTTVVSASIPGFLTTSNGSRSVTVATPTIAMSGLPATVGAGLQVFCCNARLSATDHGGVDVTITSSNPSVALVAPDQFSPGVASFTTSLSNGSRDATFVVHGVEGALGTVQITAEASGFIDGSGTVSVVQPALDIIGLNLTPSAGAADDPFVVRIGLPTPTASGLQTLQNIRIGGSAATVTVTSSTPAVGELVTTSTTGGSVTLTIPVDASQTAGSVAAGGVAFDPLSQGSTTVEATIPGFITTGNGTRAVLVGP